MSTGQHDHVAFEFIAGVSRGVDSGLDALTRFSPGVLPGESGFMSSRCRDVLTRRRTAKHPTGARPHAVSVTLPVRRSYIAPTTLTWPRLTAGATMG